MDQDIIDFAQIRDIITMAITEQIKDADFFDFYEISISIVGKINKSGMKLAFKIKNPSKLILSPDFVELKDKTANKIKDMWAKITVANETIDMKEFEFSINIDVPWLTQNMVLINVKHK